MLVGLLGTPAMGMIPWYAQDWDSSLSNQPEVVRLINERAVVYAEGNGNDAAMFDVPGGPELIHYLGLTNVWFQGLASDLVTDWSLMEVETNFYHSTNPATLTAWRRLDNDIELHWTWDMRFVQGAQAVYDSLLDASAVVNRYRVERFVGSAEIADRTEYVYAATAFVDTMAAPGTVYRYTVSSWDGTEFVPFSIDTLEVGTAVGNGPNFWVEKTDFMERYYRTIMGRIYESNLPVGYPIRFSSDQVLNPEYATLEVYRTYRQQPSPGELVDEYSGFAVSSDGRTLSLTFNTETDTLREYGGIAYRLRYDDPSLGGPIYCPREHDSWKHLVLSSFNNRMFVRTWLSYFARIDGAPQTYRDAVLAVTSAMADGSIPSAIACDGVFLDSVNGQIPSDWVHPYEYTGPLPYRTATGDMITYLSTQNPGFLHYVNTTDLILLEQLEDVDGLAGAMDEKWPNWGSWTTHSMRALWKYRGHPGWRMLMEDGRDFAGDLDDREQFMAAYLFVRDPSSQVAATKSLLGFGRWFADDPGTIPYPDDIIVLPEQMFNYKDAVSDPFSGVDWPDAATVYANSTDDSLAVAWYRNNTNDLMRTVNGRPYAYREYYVDGGGGELYRAIAVVDFACDDCDTAAVSLADIFPDKSATFYHRLKLEGGATLLAKGARLWTEPVAFTEAWPSAPEAAAIFFSEPVSSPEVVPTAVDTISGNPKYISTLRVRARHWNGQPLDIEVNCTSLNGDSEVHLYRSGHDDVTDMDYYQASIADVVAGDGTVSLPFRATGTDGLMLYGEIDVVVDAGRTQVFRDLSSSTGDLATISSAPLAYVPINSDGGTVMDLILSERDGPGWYFNAFDYGSFVPEFRDFSGDRFGTIDSCQVAAGTGCLAVADFDGDGHEDFFACNNTGSRLYRFDPDLTSYQIVTATHIPNLPDTTFAASWCDYDRDGWVDLALAGVSDGVDGIHIYRNELKELRLVQTIPLPVGGAVRDPATPYPLVWADLDPGDGGRLELIAGTTVNGIASLHVMARDTTYDKSMLRYTLNDDTNNVFPGGAPEYVSGLVLADLDGDGDQDLVVARNGGGLGAKALVFRNVGGQFVDVTAGAGVAVVDSLASALVADMDPGGKPDIITVPAVAGATPRLFLNESTSGLAFAEETTDLVPGAASGGLAYDWLGGKPNLYLAKSPIGGQVQNFFYGYIPPDGVLLGKVVRVRVGDTDVMNTSGIGTRVEVEWDGKHAYQWFDGGSGRGGQQARELVFDLGRVAGPVVVVRAAWPDGVVSNFPMFHGGEDLLNVAIERGAQPTIDESSVTASFYINTDNDNWYVFEWDADRQSVPEVHFEFDDPRSECSCGIASPTVELAWGLPEVAVQCVQADDNVYHHKLVWRHRCCDVASCNFQYKVRSCVNGVVAESGTHAFRTPKYCPSN